MSDTASDPGSAFGTVPIEITVCVGKARPTIRELMRMGPEAVLTLDKRVEDPVELYVAGQLIARGELEEVEGDPSGQLVVRLTEVADLRNGLG